MPVSQNQPLRVFLCHASQDKPIVRELHKRLASEGWIDPWLDEEKLSLGQHWTTAIEEALDLADAVIIFLSKNSVQKEGFVQRELNYAWDLSLEKPRSVVFLILFRLDDCEIPRHLRSRQWGDYFGEKKETTYQNLLRSLEQRHRQKSRLEADERARENEPARASVIKQSVEYFMGWITGLGGTAKPEAKKPLLKTKLTVGGLEFVGVPKGKFTMGSQIANELAMDDELPQHEVEIPYDYWIGRFLVTNVQYAEFAGSEFRMPRGKEDHPVVKVSYDDVQKYIAWLNQRFVIELPKGYAFCLPSEAEWEKAARGVDGREWPWGNKFDWTRCNSPESEAGGTTPVGKYSPWGDSPYGAADMVGNVKEWTRSLHKLYPYQPEDGRENQNAPGARVLRGGSFHGSGAISFDRKFTRAASRGGSSQELVRNYVGFRVAVAPHHILPVKPGSEKSKAEPKHESLAPVKPASERLKAEPRREIVLPAKAASEGLRVEPEREMIAPLSKYKIHGHAIYIFGDIEFVKVPAGKFIMGSTYTDQEAIVDEKPQHTVDIPYDYYMARFPVTNEQYAAYVKAKGIPHPVSGWEKKSDHPVGNVKWNNAMTYCRWLNDLQKNDIPSGLIFRLPTEAEWEKAARGTKGLIYPWGNSFNKNKCNSSEGYQRGTTPVGFYSPKGDSPYGCADMAGNVWEWTHSLHSHYPYEPDDGRENENPSAYRVQRGGGVNRDRSGVRAASRTQSSPYFFGSLLGFRVVVAPPIP